MKEEFGSLWDWVNKKTIGIPTNGILNRQGELVMGAGVAKDAVFRFGRDLPKSLGARVKKYGNVPFYLVEFDILSFPTKHHWKDRSSLELIRESAKNASNLAELHNLQVVLPRVGCGLGGLSWEKVKKAIEPLLDDRFTILS